MKPNFENINYEDYPELYLKIKHDAQTSYIVKELLGAIDGYIKSKQHINFKRHQPTVRALIYILEKIYEAEEDGLSIIPVHYPAAVKLYALKYLGIAHEFDDVPELKLT